MKIGTIGSGMIVNLFLDAVNQVDGVSCEAVYSRSDETAQGLTEKYDILKYFTSIEDFFKYDGIDTVYIASPNSLHYVHAKMALLHGKNVICEKPMISTKDELKELIKIASSKRKYLFEAITTVHLPNFKKVKELLNQIGSVQMVFANYLQYSSKIDAFKEGGLPNVFNPAFSGGALMDLNIYNLHFIMGLFGIPKETTYHPIKHDNGIDIGGLLVLNYDTFIASCCAGKHVQGHNGAVIYGEKGTIIVNTEVSMCSSITIKTMSVEETLNLQPITNRMVYELMVFKAIIDEKDYSTHQSLLEYSKSVYEVLHNTRKKSGIFFNADF